MSGFSYAADTCAHVAQVAADVCTSLTLAYAIAYAYICYIYSNHRSNIHT